MSDRSIEVLQRFLRRLCQQAVPMEDAVLLDRFVTANDREAFELLMARHGPMVLGTARRLVQNSHDAEDVFQAVFLSLARLAKSIRHGRALPAWLHQTTCRVAAKFRANRLAPSAPPERYEHCDPAAKLVWREVCQALDEELQRLPERLRSPLLLCYLSGLTREEAAKKLGWSLGTLKRRLEEGRKVLRIRLERRGIAAVGLALAVLTPDALQATVSKSLLDSSLRLIFSTGAVVPATISVLVLSSATTMKGLAMKSILALLAATAVGVGIYAGTGQADPSKKAEGKKEEAKPAQVEKVVQRDDPLPAGSTLRFGTSRFRFGVPILTLAVSSDGKIAVAVNSNYILGTARVFDLVSGRALYTLGQYPAAIVAAAISPDGRTIVTKQDFRLHIRDAATGKELRSIELQRANPWSENGWVAFTPDGKAIAVTSHGKVIHLIDFESGKTIRDFSNEDQESNHSSDLLSTVLGIAFSPDGKWMASGGFNNDKGTYFARLWDVQTGKELRRFMHGTHYGIPSLAFSPDAKTLATRADDGRLRLFDMNTGKERKTFPSDGVGRGLGAVAFAPDGKTVAAAGDSIRLYDAATGEERLRIDRKARGLQFTDGGKTLTGAVSGAIYRWDTATGKALTPDAAGDSSVEQIFVTPDGRRVVTRGQDGDAHLWDAATGKHLRAWKAGWQRGMAMSPDGRFLVWPVVDEKLQFTDPDSPDSIFYGNRLRLYDIDAGRFVDRFPSFKGEAYDLTFTRDGKRLFTVDHRNSMVRLWNVETGTEERSFQAVPKAEKKQSHHVWRTALAADGKTLAVAYIPDDNGRLGLSRDPHLVRVWDVTSGQVKHTLVGDWNYILGMAFSPDGRWLATTSGNSFSSTSENRCFVWDAATGKKVAALPDGLPGGATTVAFSRDDRFLATALPEGAIRLWEVATWTKRSQYKGHRDQPTALTFTPAGQLLSGSLDTTVLAWDIRPPRVTASVSLEKAWDNLAAREAGVSFQSEGRFLAVPAETVKLFAEKVKPAAALDPKRIQRLLADLDSDEYTVREAASRAIHELDEQALPYLEAKLMNPDSLEVRLRVQRILEQKRQAAITSEQLRQIRAVMVLEWIGDGESKNLLTRWAGGPVGARLTREATAALKRLQAVAKADR